MLAKKKRLREREVKKVLKMGKPFFSYTLVFRRLPNACGYPRCAIVISGKSVSNAVIRNIFRRAYYDIASQYIPHIYGDIVCVIPKKTKLTRDPECLQSIRSQWIYMFSKRLGKKY